MNSTVPIPGSLKRITPRSPANAEELRSMRAAVWHQQGIVVVPLEEIGDQWDRELLKAIASRLYGQRKKADSCGDQQ